MLMKTLCNETDFKSFDNAIRVVFNLIDPFTANNILRGTSGNNTPGWVADEGVVFVSHSLMPFKVF